MTLQFKRVVRVTINSSASGEGVIVKGLHIGFRVNQTRGPEPNKAELEIYNLAASTRQRIGRELDEVRIEAGYEGHQGVIFDGVIRSVAHSRDGVDTLTRIEAIDGDLRTGEDGEGVINHSFTVDVLVIDRVRVIVEQDLKLGVGNIEALRGRAPSKRPETVSKPARAYLNELAKTYDCQWSVQNGLFDFVSNDAPLFHTAAVKSSETGLLGAPAPREDGGVEAECLLDPALRPNGVVELLSGYVDTELGEADEKRSTDIGGGTFRIVEIEHSGSNFSEEWRTAFTGSRVENGTVARSGARLQY